MSWMSPHGNPAHLDFIAFPEELAPCSVTVGRPPSFVDPVGFDHDPVQVGLCWKAEATTSQAAYKWDRAKMLTTEGRNVIRQIMHNCPHVPWCVHPDDHLQCINDHLFQQLQCHFQANPARSRRRHVSDELWSAVRQRRQSRRLLFRNKQSWHRHLLSFLLDAWKHVARPRQHARPSSVRWNHKDRALRFANARLGKVVGVLTRCIRRLDHKDAAEHARTVLRESRRAGPAEMAAALRGVLKSGRRYKPPRVTPALHLQQVPVSDPAEVQRVLEESFARPENGVLCTIPEVAAASSETHAMPTCLDLLEIPSMAALAEAFIRQKPNKATGLSLLPAELYSADAIGAAILHMPLLLKGLAFHKLPILWKGSQCVAIPKPNKAPGSVAAWRSIALYDTAAKGIGKALRMELAGCLRKVILPGQNGSLPGDNLMIPSHCIQAYIAAAAKLGKSGAVLFLDGRAAYYSVIRQVLFDDVPDNDVTFLELLFRRLQFTDTQQAALLASLNGPGIFTQAGVPTALQHFLQTSLHGTWFTMGHGCGAQPLRCTRSGTVPGTPLADMLYAFVQSNFQRNVQEDLQTAGLTVTFSQNGQTAPMPTWADDVSIMLPFCTADQVAARLCLVAAAAEHHSRASGVEVNFDKGKTEALCFFRGPNSRLTRRQLLQGDHPSVPLALRNGRTVDLRLVDSYVHLGSVVSYSASPTADAKAKAQSAAHPFDRLRKTLLRNPELTTPEKVELVRSLIVAKLTYGASLWTPRSTAESHACPHALAKFWRFAFRPITGLSSTLLTDTEVCHALGTLAADELLSLERVRQLSLVVGEGPSALWDCLLIESAWLSLAFDALRIICSQLDFSFGRDLPSDHAVCLVFLRANAATLHRLPGKYRLSLLHDIDPAPGLAKARDHTTREKQGWILVTLPPATRASFACPVCKAVFSTKAAAASHQASRHGISIIGNTVAGSVCQVCNQQWWSTFRLKEHLRRSAPCRNAWQGADLDLPQEFETVGCRYDKAWRPPVPCFGPRPFWATLMPDAPDVHTQVTQAAATATVANDFSAGPDGNLGPWFLQLYRFCAEVGCDAMPFPVGTLAYDAACICGALPGLNPGDAATFGRVQCQLQERHHLWLRTE